jgi:hypothetical protein
MAAAISPLPALIHLGAGRFVYEDPASGTHWELGEKDRLLLVLIQAGAKDEDVQKHFAQRFGEIVAPQQLASFRRALSPARHTPLTVPKVQGPVWELKDEQRLNAVFDALGSRLDYSAALRHVLGFSLAILAATCRAPHRPRSI